jgi:hypothetical protein
MPGGLRPGQIPDWRPGAEFWKPLADGREITIYPLLYGKGRLCVGPLADPDGYDIAYRYESVGAAVKAAESWDGEKTEHPEDYEDIEFGGGAIPGSTPVNSQALQPGTKLELNDAFKRSFEIVEERVDQNGPVSYHLKGFTEDGKHVQIRAVRQIGDPVGPNGVIVTITSMSAFTTSVLR